MIAEVRDRMLQGPFLDGFRSIPTLKVHPASGTCDGGQEGVVIRTERPAGFEMVPRGLEFAWLVRLSIDPPTDGRIGLSRDRHRWAFRK